MKSHYLILYVCVVKSYSASSTIQMSYRKFSYFHIGKQEMINSLSYWFFVSFCLSRWHHKYGILSSCSLQSSIETFSIFPFNILWKCVCMNSVLQAHYRHYAISYTFYRYDVTEYRNGVDTLKIDYFSSIMLLIFSCILPTTLKTDCEWLLSVNVAIPIALAFFLSLLSCD